MNNKNIKVIDDHNIDRNANIMFAIDLEGSEYVVYSIERDTESNNVFVSRVLKDVDGTSNMLNIDEVDKKEEVANIVKLLISTAVSNQNSKLTSSEMNLSDGKTVKFVGVSFNKEQKISVQKTYITTVKKEVINVAEKYYDVVVVSPVQEIPEPAPVEVFSTITPVVSEPVAIVNEPQVVPSVVTPTSVEVIPELPSIPVVEASVAPSVVVSEPAVAPTPVVVTPEPVVVSQPAVVETPQVVAPTVVVQPTSVVSQPTVTVEPVAAVPVAEPVSVEPHAVQPTPVVPEPIPDAFSQPLVFNASKETNLNAALGEAAAATNIPVESIQPVKEFGVDEPVKPTVSQPAPAVAPVVQPEVAQVEPKVLSKKAGFANSKFFMVVAVAFFLASCIFLGYEVFNYFQLIK